MDNLISLHFIAANVGIMVFFPGIVAPIVFKNLSGELASKYLRAFFPRFYLVLAITTLVSALLNPFPAETIMLFIVTFLFLVSFWPLTPAINKASDQKKTTRFKVLHSLSVALLIVQLIIFFLILGGQFEPTYNGDDTADNEITEIQTRNLLPKFFS